MQLAAKIAAALILLVLALIALGFATGNFRRPLRYEIAADYRGWTVVEYSDPNCPPLKTAWLYLVIEIPASGRVCTSSELPKGWLYEQFEYVNGQGRQRVLRSSGWDSDPEVWGFNQEKRETVFIGSKEELDKNWASKPRK